MIFSHVLPGMDDGARTAEESINILALLEAQGVQAVIGTPHFYSHANTPERFLENRQKAYMKIVKQREGNRIPQVYLGAEVRYFRGISKAKHLEKLTLGGSPYLLIEPPFSAFSSYMIDEIQDLAVNRELFPIIAHVERYFRWNRKEAVAELFHYQNVMGQVNADSLVGFRSRRQLARLVEAGYCHFIGSDAHDMEKRKPDMERALILMEQYFGANSIGKIGQHNAALYSAMVLPEKTD